MKRLVLILLILTALATGLVVLGNLELGPLVITREGEQKLILFFGDVLTVTEPGISAYVPVLMDLEVYDPAGSEIDSDLGSCNRFEVPCVVAIGAAAFGSDVSNRFAPVD